MLILFVYWEDNIMEGQPPLFQFALSAEENYLLCLMVEINVPREHKPVQYHKWWRSSGG